MGGGTRGKGGIGGAQGGIGGRTGGDRNAEAHRGRAVPRGTDFDRMLNRAKGVQILGGYRFCIVTCCMLFFACQSVFIFSSVLAAWIIQILNLILNYTPFTMVFKLWVFNLFCLLAHG